MCLVLVIVQTYWSIKKIFYSGKTITTTTVNRLDEVEFPLIFNIIVSPGFDAHKLVENGYKDVHTYFVGKHMNVFGWTGYGGNLGNVSGKVDEPKREKFGDLIWAIKIHLGPLQISFPYLINPTQYNF
jgi:hypothetical protein